MNEPVGRQVNCAPAQYGSALQARDGQINVDGGECVSLKEASILSLKPNVTPLNRIVGRMNCCIPTPRVCTETLDIFVIYCYITLHYEPIERLPSIVPYLIKIIKKAFFLIVLLFCYTQFIYTTTAKIEV